MNNLETLDISAIARLEMEFNDRLSAIKAQSRPANVEWYPYQSLGSLNELTTVLTGRRRSLGQLIGSDPVLDIGCGDGDLAFFLESLGCTVDAIDYPPTNFNQLKGALAMRKLL